MPPRRQSLLTSLGRTIQEQEMIEHAASIQRRAAARHRLLSAGERIQQLARVEQDETIAFEKGHANPRASEAESRDIRFAAG
jgi:hypothetical protein